MRATVRSIAIVVLVAALAALATCGKKREERADKDAAGSGVTRIADCDRFIARYQRCDKLSAQQRADFEGALAQWKLMLKSGDAAVAKSVQQACQKAAPDWEKSLSALGC